MNVALVWPPMLDVVGRCCTMLDDVGGILTSVKNVGYCRVMLEWFGHSIQQNHVRASAVRKAHNNLICFASGANVSYKIEGKQQEKNQRYETFSSDEEENDNFSFDSMDENSICISLIQSLVLQQFAVFSFSPSLSSKISNRAKTLLLLVFLFVVEPPCLLASLITAYSKFGAQNISW